MATRATTNAPFPRAGAPLGRPRCALWGSCWGFALVLIALGRRASLRSVRCVRFVAFASLRSLRGRRLVAAVPSRPLRGLSPPIPMPAAPSRRPLRSVGIPTIAAGCVRVVTWRQSGTTPSLKQAARPAGCLHVVMSTHNDTTASLNATTRHIAPRDNLAGCVVVDTTPHNDASASPTPGPRASRMPSRRYGCSERHNGIPQDRAPLDAH